MINLLQYDDIIDVVDKNKTWYNVKSNSIFSREIVRKPYYTFKKRWVAEHGDYSYYLIVSDKNDDKSSFKFTYVDDYGRIKFRCTGALPTFILSRYNHDANISIRVVEEDDESVVYELFL